MTELDLLPVDYAREQALWRRLRRAGAIVLFLAGLMVAARLGLGVLIATERAQVASLHGKKALWQESRSKTEKYASDALAMQQQLAALEQLRGRDQLRLFLEAVDSAYVANVWFDEVKYYRRETALASAPGLAAALRSATAARPEATAVEQRVGMSGHALNHVTLAEFMRRLERQPGVAELSLVDTSPRSYPRTLIIDFKLALLVEQKRKGQP